MNSKSFELGVIEGFYGAPWSWDIRKEYAEFLKRVGYSFYYYAPKSDPFFRRKWREAFPQELYEQLAILIDAYHAAGVEFGVGFSPYEIYLAFDDDAKKHLQARIEVFNRLGVDRLAILFDDMKCAPGLARTQAEILHWVRDRSHAKQLIMCPTYYSLDPILDKIFGERPADYLEVLGSELDTSIGVIWTGEEVCSKQYTEKHLSEINEKLHRKVWLWDNYPVNDGPKMCKFLHVDSFRNRPAILSDLLQAHAVNPMNQPHLSQIPMLTLKESYRDRSAYNPETAFLRAATTLVNPKFAAEIQKDLHLFTQKGFEQLSETEKQNLILSYSRYKHPVADEIVSWLEGKTIVTREVFLTQ